MSGLLILGAGGHGKVVADLAETLALWDDIVFLDDRHPQLASQIGHAVVGRLDGFRDLRGRCSSAIAAFGDNAARLRWCGLLEEAGFDVPVLVHPRAWVSRHAEVGAGTVLCAMAAVGPGARLGRAVIVNTGATVDHDCMIGDGVHVCPGAHIAGAVEAATLAWIGVGACVRQCIKIGADAVVGAGAAVVSDVAPRATVMGVPARIEKHEHDG